MTWPRLPRRFCKHCRVKRCKKAAHVYCSDACSRAGRRKPRRLCPICRVNPVKLRHQKTCGRSCGALSRGAEGKRTRDKALKLMWVARQAKFVKRLAAHLRDEEAALEAAATPVERAKVLARIYQRGRHDERQANRYRAIAQRRMSA